MWAADGQESIPHREWLIMFDRVVNEVKAEMEPKGRGGEFVGAKVWSILEAGAGLAKSRSLDHLQHHPIFITGRIGVVLGRLYRAQERIPSPHCRYVQRREENQSEDITDGIFAKGLTWSATRLSCGL
jgi:hypothetical protein